MDILIFLDHQVFASNPASDALNRDLSFHLFHYQNVDFRQLFASPGKKKIKKIVIKIQIHYPLDTVRKLNVHKTFRRRPKRLLNVLCTLNLRLI